MRTKAPFELTVILGAPDPEAAAIEGLARECGCGVLYAAACATRVNPGNAYAATGTLDSSGVPTSLPVEAAFALVECDFRLPVECDARRFVARCDHHRPRDAGYGRPPAEFLPASSLGQVISLLAGRDLLPPGWHRSPRRLAPGALDHEGGAYGRVWRVGTPKDAGRGKRESALVPATLVLAAAADHCLAAAYAGQCPGVDPAALAAWRDASRAAFQQRSVEAVRADREAAERIVARAEWRPMGHAIVACNYHGGGPWYEGCGCDEPGQAPIAVADLRSLGAVPELPEAAARLGRAVLYRLPPTPREPPGSAGKLGLLGAGEGTPTGTTPVEAFLVAARDGAVAGTPVLADPASWGDSSRGFAGAWVRGTP